MNKEKRKRVSNLLLIAAAGLIIIGALFGTGVVSAQTTQNTSNYLITDYVNGQQVVVSISAQNSYYQNLPVTVQIYSNGQAITLENGQTQLNFTGNTQISFYTTQAFSVYIKDSQGSIIASQIFQAPHIVHSGISYEALGIAGVICVISSLVSYRMGKNSKRNGKGKPIANQYSEEDMDAVALASAQIGKVYLDVDSEVIEGIRTQFPQVWKQIEEFPVKLADAVLRYSGADPQEFLDVVRGGKKETISINSEGGTFTGGEKDGQTA